jgi:hypothetical protein
MSGTTGRKRKPLDQVTITLIFFNGFLRGRPVQVMGRFFYGRQYIILKHHIETHAKAVVTSTTWYGLLKSILPPDWKFIFPKKAALKTTNVPAAHNPKQMNTSTCASGTMLHSVIIGALFSWQ